MFEESIQSIYSRNFVQNMSFVSQFKASYAQNIPLGPNFSSFTFSLNHICSDDSKNHSSNEFPKQPLNNKSDNWRWTMWTSFYQDLQPILISLKSLLPKPNLYCITEHEYKASTAISTDDWMSFNFKNISF